MNRRNLILVDGTWRYRVGRNTTELWTPGGRKVIVENWRLSGAPDDSEWQSSCSEGPGIPITPGLLRTYIERERP